MKAKLTLICEILVLSIILVFSFSGCKDFGVPNYELTIKVEDGVSGSPSEGVYSYKELETIDYEYLPENDDLTVEVLVNGGRWATSGTVTIYNNITVEARLFDIREDTWTFYIFPPDDSDEDTVEATVTFTGSGYLSGEFTDVREDGQTYKGLWTITDDTLQMNYSDWQNYIFTGTVPTMTGSWTGEGEEGTWSSTR